MGYALIRPRRGTNTEWSLVNPVIEEGELIVVCPDSGVGTGLSKFKIGDGKTTYQNLPWAFDAGAAYINGGTVDAFNVISLRGGTTQEWEEANPVLELYEVVYDSTKNALKIGDGVSHFMDLKYCGGQEEQSFDFGILDEYDIGEDVNPDPTPGTGDTDSGNSSANGSGQENGSESKNPSGTDSSDTEQKQENGSESKNPSGTDSSDTEQNTDSKDPGNTSENGE